MNYILTGILYFLIGVGVYAIEKWIATKLLKKDLKTYKGFVIGGKKRNKYIVATLVMIIKFWVSIKVFNAKSDPTTILFTALEWVSVMLGLYFGGWALPKLQQLRNKGEKYVDDLETGKADLLKDIKDGVSNTLKETTAISTNSTTTSDSENQNKEEGIVEEKKETPTVIKESVKEKDNRTPQEKMKDSVSGFLNKNKK